MSNCIIQGCFGIIKCRQLCNKHYIRQRKTGELQKLHRSTYQRFIEKVHKTNMCWLWTAQIATNGYGCIKYDGKPGLAHRLSYELFKGEIPNGLQIDHLCRVRKCVNPDHLEAVTPKVNMHRGETLAAANAVKTHCPKGHEYNHKNTRRWKGRRICRSCGAINQLKYTAKKKLVMI